MAGRMMAAAVAGAALLLSATASAAPIAAQAAPGAGVQARASTATGDHREDLTGRTWIVSVLALLAVVGGIIAAASGDSQPESP